MSLTFFQWYIIVINLIAFIVFIIDYQIYCHGGEGIQPQVLCNLVTIFGGAFGAFVAETLCQRKITKYNVQSRIYTFIWLFLQLVFFWILWGPNHEAAREQILSFYNGHRIICIYYAGINVVSFIAFAADKIKAMRGAWRISEFSLLGLCLIGGGVGGILAMDICNHKVTKMYFMFGVTAMICLHLVLLSLVLIGAI